MKNSKFLLSIILLIGIWILFFYPVIFQSRIFFSHDIKTFYYPYHNYCSKQISRGIIPLWSSLSSCGFPVHGAAELGVFYPLNWLWQLVFSQLEAFSIGLIFHYLLAGFFILLLQKERGIIGFPALYSALIFAFSGFMITHLIHSSIISASAWLPLLFYFIIRWRKTRITHYLLLSGITVGMQFLVSHPQIAIISIFSASLYILITADKTTNKGLLNTISWKVFTIATMLIIVFGIAAVQIIPTFETYIFSQRGGLLFNDFHFQGSLQPQMLINLIFPIFFGIVHPSEVTGYGFVSPLYWGQGGAFWEMCGYTGILSLIFLLPVVFSRLLRKKSRAFLILAASSLLLSLGKWGGIYYLFLFFPGAGHLRFPSRFLLIWVFCVAVLAGDGLTALLQNTERKAILRSAKVVLVFILILLLSFTFTSLILHKYKTPILHFGQNWIEKNIVNKPGHHLPLTRYYRKLEQGINGLENSINLQNRNTLKQFLLLLLSWLILRVQFNSQNRRILTLLAAITILLFFDNGAFSYSYNKTISKAEAEQKPYSAVFIKAADSKHLSRICSLDRRGKMENELLKPSYNILFQIPSIFTPGPLMDKRLHRWLKATGTGIYPFDVTVKQKKVLSSMHLLNLLNVKWFLTQQLFPENKDLLLVSKHDLFIYKNLGMLPRITLVHKVQYLPEKDLEQLPQYLLDNKIDSRQIAVLSNKISNIENSLNEKIDIKINKIMSGKDNYDEINVISYNEQSMKIRTHSYNKSLVRISDAFYPGWTATVDEKKTRIIQADGFFKAVFVPRGTHLLSIKYQPFSFRLGLFISLISLSFLILFTLLKLNLPSYLLKNQHTKETHHG